jgi:hypothetical protein
MVAIMPPWVWALSGSALLIVLAMRRVMPALGMMLVMVVLYWIEKLLRRLS